MRLLFFAVVLLSLACVDGRDKYEVLGVYGSAKKGDIRQKYRELSKKYHPDTLRGKTEEEQKKAKAEFEEITAAFRVLIDPVKRKRYDEFGDERGGDDNSATLAKLKAKKEEDDYEGGFMSYLPMIWLALFVGLAFSGLIKDDPSKRKQSSKKNKGKKGGGGPMDQIMGVWTWFLDSNNQTKLIIVGIVGMLLLSVLTMDSEDLTGPKERTQDQKDYDYMVKGAYADLETGKPHRALKAFNMATDNAFGKTQPGPYIEMSKILIDLNQADNAHPLLEHAFSIFPEVKEVKDRKGAESYLKQAFLANYDVTDEGSAMSDEADFKELKAKYHDGDAKLMMQFALKYFNKKRTRDENLAEKLLDFKKGIYDGIEDNSGDAVNSDEFSEDDQDDVLDHKPDYDKMMDDEDEDE